MLYSQANFDSPAHEYALLHCEALCCACAAAAIAASLLKQGSILGQNFALASCSSKLD